MNHAIPPAEHYVGLMTGTSLDAVDAALVRITGHRIILNGSQAVPLSDELRRRIAAVTPDTALREILKLDHQLALRYAEAVTRLLRDAGVDHSDIQAVGCHGQTVWHEPDSETPTSLQLGNPSLLAQQLGLTVVADFRRRDIAAGGQGAPLAPAFHHAMFASKTEPRVVVNLGGMANITLLPDATPEHIGGFDTGPGNVLMDAWIDRHQAKPFDRHGSWAAGAAVDGKLLDILRADPYFAAAPPKSTGREYFNLDWLDLRLDLRPDLDPRVVQATLCELTAGTIRDAIRKHAPDSKRVLLCGGGTHNRHLCSRIAAGLPELKVEFTDDHGAPADWVEAMGFAWLARETLAGRPGNVPAVTGAERAVVLGGVYHR
ncbi:anhydro-N-acetylmuramic acid kinase [Methylonatrum kenyense]|uniref:anhydro-N-acetylmuramic acid kinase n=1 Tax=Methylonatrum kenyense TaxID=455253 RepID=UPI0020BEA639|nr:anhydro-N-acetylmuramic acid kinase [Methylonatrum kenyense]MCK8517170.1 anhydro-N-acetylmuramic acid kinase [Methylonatrum kenyense]